MVSIGTLVFILLIIGIFVLLAIGISKGFSRTSYEVQQNMTKDYSKAYKEIELKDFIAEFKTKKWTIKDQYKYSFFPRDIFLYDTNKIHAGIWMINGIGLLPKDFNTYKEIEEFLKQTWNTWFLLDENKSS